MIIKIIQAQALSVTVHFLVDFIECSVLRTINPHHQHRVLCIPARAFLHLHLFMHPFWPLHEMCSWQTLMPQEVFFSWIGTDYQWPSPSPTELVETVLIQVPKPTPDIPALVESSFDMLPKGSSCWGNQRNVVLLCKQFPANCVDICCCAGSL